MKITWLWCLIALLSVGSAAWPQDTKGDIEKSVLLLSNNGFSPKRQIILT